MSAEDDPPRLRSLAAELPAALALALEGTHVDEPTPEALALLKRSLDRAVDAHGESRSSSRVLSVRRRPRVRFAVLVSTFALGAGAGVVVSGVVYFASQHTRESMPSTAASSLVAAPSRAPERAAPLTLATGNPAAAVDSAHVPQAPAPRTDAPSGVDSLAADAGDRAELELIGRAQAALATDPGLALALAREHERKFSAGALVQEREVIAIAALLRLARRVEAEALVLRFHQQFPRSVHGRRLDVLLSDAGGTAVDHN